MDDALRLRSKTLFGNRYMLEVCRAVGTTEGRLNLSSLAAVAGLSSPSLYSVPISRLRTVGLLVPAPSDADDHRERWYRREESLLWAAALELSSGLP